MFSQDLKDKYSFLTDYFEQGLKNVDRNIAHSILFYGQDISAQYELATEIARLLNCNEFRTADCKCLNCNWVREKKHPSVLTISKIDNKPSDDDSKTVISVKQSQMIKNSLLNTSDYHRVFIFCDAEIQKVNDEEKWVPLGLNQLNFQEETANSLLKIIEEPPSNTTFFFLTRDKNDLLQTIISRSQSFFVPSFVIENTDYSAIENVFSDYFELERNETFDFALKIFSLTKEYGSDVILSQIQNYMLGLLKSNLENPLVKRKILQDLNAVEKAQKMIGSRINPQLAIEDMCLNFTSR